MNFKPLFLFEQRQIGIDALNNPIFRLEKTGESEGMFTSWTNRELSADSINLAANKRAVTVENRKIVTKAKRNQLKDVVKVFLDGKYYNIKEIKGDESTRWSVLIVNRYGSESLES